jgi:phosphopantothenoylcysteine synthetase/decarboxylase
MSTIILGITGSIAAYKAAGIASQLTAKGHNVHCVLTKAGAGFITPLTLQVVSRNEVFTDFSDVGSWKPGHINLADQADLLLVAPATANTIAHFATGIAPDPLCNIYLATRAPVLIAPAMNGKMWEHTATQRNVETLKNDGVHFIGPAENGMLACGYTGSGRLIGEEAVIAKAEQLLEIKN